jgi:aromatic-L-amino-acid decarboxylase
MHRSVEAAIAPVQDRRNDPAQSGCPRRDMNPPSELDFDGAGIAQAGALLVDLLTAIEQSVRERPVVPVTDRAVLTDLLHEPFPEDGVGIDALFADIADRIVPHSTAVAHPRFLAYVLGPPNGIAPFADAIASALNQNCNFWQLSPAASVIERRVVSWLAGLFEYPDTAGGLMTSGGSMATHVALTAAIHDRYPGDPRATGWQARGRPLVLYTSEEAHGCVAKAAVGLGLGLDNVRRVAVDADFRMRPDRLAAAIRDDRRAGLQPFCVVATAGTIATGAIDPLDELEQLCASEELWLHVDGAFGALFVLSDAIREQLHAAGRADSLALDPHKLLFAPLEAGCLIVRDPETLRHAFDFSASYLAADPDPLLVNFMELGPQLSRDFKAFKVWSALRTFGVAAFRQTIDHMLALARHLEGRIEREPALELLAPVTLTAVCFTVKDVGDAGNQDILRRLAESGVALLGPVRIRERVGLRACITNHRTTKDDIDATVDAVLRLAAGHPA